MFNAIYNWYYYNNDEIDRAKEQVDFFKKKIDEVYKRKDISQEDKDKKISRMRQVISSIEYTYSLD
tara:strand:+ start:425 stop:622 length:198 start_codon:yes stop_codon:yes gene_type:complete